MLETKPSFTNIKLSFVSYCFRISLDIKRMFNIVRKSHPISTILKKKAIFAERLCACLSVEVLQLLPVMTAKNVKLNEIKFTEDVCLKRLSRPINFGAGRIDTHTHVMVFSVAIFVYL